MAYYLGKPQNNETAQVQAWFCALPRPLEVRRYPRFVSRCSSGPGAYLCLALQSQRLKSTLLSVFIPNHNISFSFFCFSKPTRINVHIISWQHPLPINILLGLFWSSSLSMQSQTSFWSCPIKKYVSYWSGNPVEVEKHAVSTSEVDATLANYYLKVLKISYDLLISIR